MLNQWYYSVLQFDRAADHGGLVPGDALRLLLKEQGDDGWELVQVVQEVDTHLTLICKRQGLATRDLEDEIRYLAAAS